ncbi:MAG: GGDEF domain-containing protein [Gammaproteobacteria bacterium]|nr:GGDEF domain-containing protein [Gammaproteobacteria bacterium]
MIGKQSDKKAAVGSCPAGDDKCTNLSEVGRLQEEVRQLAALVRTDELTRLFNFRYFNQALSLEMERTRRSGQPTCLIMLDLDHFKAVNDAYGHEAGNVVLGHISNLIKRAVRRLDIPCRYGGEEFTIILPDTTLKQGVRFANRLRLIIENSPVKTNDALLGIEASFGVDVYMKDDEVTEKEFVKNVDSFLYLAKQEGRNKVCHSSISGEDSSDLAATKF